MYAKFNKKNQKAQAKKLRPVPKTVTPSTQESTPRACPPGLSLNNEDTWSNWSGDSDQYAVDAQYQAYQLYLQNLAAAQHQPFTGFEAYEQETSSLPVDFGIDEFDNSDNAAGVSSGFRFAKFETGSQGSTSEGDFSFSSPSPKAEVSSNPAVVEYNEVMKNSTLQQRRKLQKKVKLCLQVNGIEMASFETFTKRSPAAREELSMLLWNCDMNVHKVLNTYWSDFAKVGMTPNGESIVSLMDHGKRLRGFFNLKLAEWSASKGWELEPKTSSPAFLKMAEQMNLDSERLAEVVKAQALIRQNADNATNNKAENTEELEAALALVATVEEREVFFLQEVETKQMRVELLSNELFNRFEQFVVMSRLSLGDMINGDGDAFKRSMFESVMHPGAKDARAGLFAQFKNLPPTLALSEEFVNANGLVVGQRVKKNAAKKGAKKN